MKYCRFQQNSQAHYGLVESVAGREAIVRILLTSPEEAGGDMESLRTRRIEPIALDESHTASAGTAFENRMRRTQLTVSTPRTGQRGSDRPLLFLSPLLPSCARRDHSPSKDCRAYRLRG